MFKSFLICCLVGLFEFCGYVVDGWNVISCGGNVNGGKLFKGLLKC